MATTKPRGEQLNIADIAQEIAADPGATAALAETFFPYTGGTILGETVLCYNAPCVWYKDPGFPGCDTGHLWRTVARNGVFSVNVNSGSFQSVPPFSIPGGPGVNGFIAQGPPAGYAQFVPGYVFAVCGNGPNDGIYKVAAPVQVFGPDTMIPVVQTIPNPGAPGGVIQDFTFETEMLSMELTSGVTVPNGVRLTADGGLEVQSFFDVFVDIDMNNNDLLNVKDVTFGGVLSGTGEINIVSQPNKNKLCFHYDTFTNLPSNTTYHGMFAHVHDTASAWFAHSAAWIELAQKSLSVQKSGDTMSGALAMGGFKVTGLANGGASGDALHFGQIGGAIEAWSPKLDALAAISGSGLVVHDNSGFFGRTILGGVGLTATNGNGVAGNPSLAVDAFKAALVSFDFASIPAFSTAETTVTVTGAVFGDPVAITVESLETGLMLSAFVSATGVVTIRLGNVTNAPIDPAAHTFNVIAFSFAGF